MFLLIEKLTSTFFSIMGQMSRRSGALYVPFFRSIILWSEFG